MFESKIIAYSKEMKEQDDLIKHENENRKAINAFFHEIMDEARSRGLKEIYEVNDYIDGIEIHLYTDPEHYQKYCSGIAKPNLTATTCKELIEYVETQLDPNIII